MVVAAARVQQVERLEAREHPQEVGGLARRDAGPQDALVGELVGEPRHAEHPGSLPAVDRPAGRVLAEG
jgi:hypothetical protein